MWVLRRCLILVYFLYGIHFGILEQIHKLLGLSYGFAMELI